MARVYEKLGLGSSLENTPQYDLYQDESQNKHTFTQLEEELEPMPGIGDHSIKAEILLPRGDMMARGHVMVQWEEPI